MCERGSYKKVHEVVDQVSSEVRMELGLKKYEVVTVFRVVLQEA